MVYVYHLAVSLNKNYYYYHNYYYYYYYYYRSGMVVVAVLVRSRTGHGSQRESRDIALLFH